MHMSRKYIDDILQILVPFAKSMRAIVESKTLPKLQAVSANLTSKSPSLEDLSHPKYYFNLGIDEEDKAAPAGSKAPHEEMPPLEGDYEDASNLLW